MSGKAYLVGAGPGSPDLITLRGARLLQQADVIVHDRLVDSRLLKLAPSETRILDVGKGPGEKKYAQEEINQMLISLVQAGKQVVRLKGGDPFIFGRGQEERDALAQAGCEVEVVPGVSSATGVPTAAGIPLTHRDIASDFAVITGRFAQGKTHRRSNWESLVDLDTLVVLMGMGAASEVQAGMLEAGKSPETPAVIVSQGTWSEQQVWNTDLAHLAETVATNPIPGPSIIILGDVVKFRLDQSAHETIRESPPFNDWESPPRLEKGSFYPLTLTRLQGRRILVVGGGPVGERKCKRLVATGAKITLCSPTLTPNLEDMANRDVITWRRRNYHPRDLENSSLVFAATNDPELNEQIAQDATAEGVFCNVATSSDGGDFTVPALVQVGDSIVAVTSFAGKPRTAQKVRDRIKEESQFWFISRVQSD